MNTSMFGLVIMKKVAKNEVLIRVIVFHVIARKFVRVRERTSHVR